jgi:hypothetical protein
MADRVLAVNAYTTFTLLDGELEGHGWRTDAPAVVNVTSRDGTDGGASDDDTDDAASDRVLVELELDDAATERVPPHADRLALSPAEARELAAALESQADGLEE